MFPLTTFDWVIAAGTIIAIIIIWAEYIRRYVHKPAGNTIEEVSNWLSSLNYDRSRSKLCINRHKKSEKLRYKAKRYYEGKAR